MLDWFRKQSAGNKLITVSAIGLLVGLGLCGASGLPTDPTHPELVIYAAFAVFWLSALGLIVAFVWAAFSGLMTKRDK